MKIDEILKNMGGIRKVIGTKIATKVLKDGMMIEVDANHGVVKIL